MKQVCLVYMETGSYDSYSNNVILAFETLEEGEQAIKEIEKELEQLWKIGDTVDLWRALPVAERGPGSMDRLNNIYATKVREIVKVLPVEYSEHNGVTIVSGIPSESYRKHGELDFNAVMQPISSLKTLIAG